MPFPGGFLFAINLENAKKLGAEIKILSDKYNINIALGIDIKQKYTKENTDDLIKQYSLPWLAVVISPGNKEVYLWRQRSSNSKDQKYANSEICREARTLDIGSKTIEVLICGEIFNPKIRSSIVERGITTAIDLGHTSGGFRVASAMKVLAKNGVKTFCSIHAEIRNAMKYSYGPGKSNEIRESSTRDIDVLIGEEPRLEIVIWDI